ncbi:HD family phosphohydrolase [Capnocytophaga canimorsus]|uniref:HD family phosphohydrolase n=1 Tax=Capnocytophaga canimorsus TaxID=28188 RepID=UPI0037CD1D33
MRKYWQKLNINPLFLKILIAVITVVLVVQVFPKKAKFKYEFQKGKLWQHETFYAPFEFPLKKSEEQIAKETEQIVSKSVVYYTKDTLVYQHVLQRLPDKITTYFGDKISENRRQEIIDKVTEFLKKSYRVGVFINSQGFTSGTVMIIGKQNQVSELLTSEVFFLEQLNDYVTKELAFEPQYRKNYQALLFEIMQPDLRVEQKFTQKALDENLKDLVYTYGIVNQGQLIIAKGEMVEGERLAMLESLQSEYESETWNQSNYYWSLLGYYTLVSICIFIVLVYLQRYAIDIYNDNIKLSFIFFNVLLIIYLVSFFIKTFPDYIYVAPVCLMLMILKSFFDLRTAIFVFVITILLTGFITPNSFQFIFIQIIAGAFIILNTKDTQYRLNNFISAAYTTIAYLFTYMAFHLITEGQLHNLHVSFLIMFLLNGMGMLFSQPLTYIYERVFGLVCDASLLELTDTNSKLLRELSEKAPGTFQHSMQVANLAEAAAVEIKANALLVRVGALYHDIGKMKNPVYFIENQKTNINPHDCLTPTESARIIINHVAEGVEIARKHKLPERIIEFIKTHHGNSLLYYFYRKEMEQNEQVIESDFRYAGPIPSSKETAILMMADSVEAASRSLKNPTYPMIDEFVESIIKKQFDDHQFMNSDITLKEIERIKAVFKDKLTNIYHLRIPYPK